MNYHKGQSVKYYEVSNKKTYFGKITKTRDSSISILWDTGIEHVYYTNGDLLRLGKIEVVHKFPENNPNRRFLEDGKRV